MDPLFKEAWGNLANRENDGRDFNEDTSHAEHGDTIIQNEDLNTESEKILLTLKEISDKGEVFKELFNTLLKSMLRYAEKVDKLRLARLKSDDKTEKEDADSARGRAHEAVISNINIFSRYCRKMGVDNSWINVIGSDRDKVRDFALSVANLAGKIALE